MRYFSLARRGIINLTYLGEKDNYNGLGEEVKGTERNGW